MADPLRPSGNDPTLKTALVPPAPQPESGSVRGTGVRPLEEKDRMAPKSERKGSLTVAKRTVPPGVSEPGPLSALTPTQCKKELAALERAIHDGVKAAGPRLGSAVADRIDAKRQTLAKLLQYGELRTAGDAERLCRAYLALQRELANVGVNDATTAGALVEARAAVLGKIAADLGLEISPRVTGERLVGLTVTRRDGQPLGAEQSAVSAVVRTLVDESERLRAAPPSLGAKEIALLDLRDALLRRNLELMSPSTPTPWPEGTATEIDLLSGAIAAVDDLLTADVPVPPDLLARLDGLRANLEGGAAVGQSLEQLGATLDPQGVANLGALGQTGAPGTPEEIGKGLTQTHRALLELLAHAPHGTTGAASQVLAAYTAGMNALEGVLPPPLPFVYTLPYPVVFDDGQGHQFKLAAGTRISSDPSGAYIAQTPGFLMTSGGTTIAANQGTLRLGGGLDQLSFQSFGVHSGNTHLALLGMQGEINREHQTALIVADRVDLDTATSHLELVGAQIAMGPNATHVGAASLLFEQGGNHFSLEDLAFDHTLENGTSTVSLGATSLDALVGTTGITAEQLSVTFVQSDDPTAPASLQLLGSGVHLAVGDAVIDAASANLQFVRQPDGSSVLTIGTGDLSVATGGGTLTTVGQTRVNVTYGANGQPSGTSFAADSLRFVDAGNNTLQAGGGAMNVAFTPNGQVSGITASAQTLGLAGHGSQLDVTGGSLALTYDQGVLQSALATAGSAHYLGAGHEATATGGTLGLQFGASGTLERLTGSAETFAYQGQGVQVNGTQAALELSFGDGGRIAQVSAQSGTTDITGAFGQVHSSGLATLAATYGASGTLQSLALRGDDVTYLSGGTNAHVKGGNLGATFDAAGRLATLQASASQGSFAGGFGTLTLAGGAALDATFNQGALAGLSGTVDGLHLNGAQGQLDLPHATVNGTFNPDGTLAELRLHGDGARFDGSALNGQLTHLAFDHADARLTSGPDGQVLTFSGDSGTMTVAGHQIGIAEVEQLQVRANAEGVITGIDARFPGPVTFDEAGGSLSVRVVDLQGSLATQPAEVCLSFAQADVLLRSEGLQATLHDGQVSLGERELRVHVGEASLLQQVAGQLGVSAEVVGLDLVLRRDANGAITDLETAVKDLAAHTESFNLLVRNEEGQQLRLHTQFGADGTAIRSVFLQVPQGGEVLVSSDDLSARFGPMTAALTRGDDGAMRLSTSGLDVDATWKDLSVHVDSETIDVGLDPKRGLLINHISGTSVRVQSAELDVDIDITAMDNLLLRMTGVSGLAQGAMLELVPSGPDSRITARLSTSYNGIPISLELDDLGALQAGGTVQTNQVHVLLADPTGEGKITASAGPVKLEGSAIELFARYRQYDAQRMLGAVGRFMSTDGVQLTRALSIESDGVVRLGTPGSGLFAETAVLLPRASASAPGYLWSMGAPLMEQHDQGGTGFLLNLGGAGTSRAGTRYVGSVFVGAVPGSYLEVDRTRGDMSVFGVPLPKRMTVPTTAVGGLNFRAHGKDARFDATLGAFVNPAGLVEGDARQYIEEQTPGGLFGGVSYRNDRFSAGLDAVVDVDREHKPQLGGVRLTLGWRF